MKPGNVDSNIATAKQILKEAEHYLTLKDSAKAAQLLDEVERLVIEIAKSLANNSPSKAN